MTTRRERLEAKLEKRAEWADKAASRASAELNRAHQMASIIPFGQPILIGHHSESRDRNYRGRIHNTFGRGFAQMDLAAHHQSKAAGLEAQLAHSVFSDDENAIEAIEARIAEHEASRERMKLVNKLYKKGDVEGLKALGIDFETRKAELAKEGGYWGSAPYLPYQLSNLGGRIQADRKRIAEIKARQARTAKADAAGGMTIERHSMGYATIVFAEKPERSVLNDLRGAWFRWGGGSWFGQTEKLPASVLALEAPKETAAHARDSDCTVDTATGLCTGCGALHGDPCPDCGGAGYHVDGCAVLREMEAPDAAMAV